MESLPSSYRNLVFYQIRNILQNYPYPILLEAAKNGNLKAQHAILVKLELELDEFKDMNERSRIDLLLELCKSFGIKEIAGNIKQIVMGMRMYDPDYPYPTIELVEYGISKMREIGLEKESLEWHINDLRHIYKSKE